MKAPRDSMLEETKVEMETLNWGVDMLENESISGMKL